MVTEDRLGSALGATQKAAIEFVRRYHRLEVTGDLARPERPVLFVSNHGFGSIFDLNVITAIAALDDLQLDRDVTILVHQLAWTVGLGPLLERLGARKASADAASEAFGAGRHVLVFPGGDLDAFKAHRDKDRIVFEGRTGFARVAQRHDVPVVPIVTAGTGDTLYVISDGQWLARALRLNRLLRLKALPLTVSIPWGVNVGLVGFLPYLPLPVQLRTEILPAVTSPEGEPSTVFAARVEEAMQAVLDRN